MRKVRVERTIGDGESRCTVSVEIESDYTTLEELGGFATGLLNRLDVEEQPGPSRPELVKAP